MLGGDVSDQEDNKYNIEAHHEIMDVREAVKTNKENYEIKRALELEKEQKRAKRNK